MRVFQQPYAVREPAILAEARIDGGQNTRIDPADLPNDTFVDARNVRVTSDRTQRAVGTAVFTPVKPNSNRVLLFTSAKRFDGTSIYMRFDTQKLHRITAGSWVEITGSGFASGVTQRPRLVTLNDRYFFINGRDYIQEINFTANTYARLGNAPRYTYACGFFNRLVGANLYDASSPNPVQIGWSGDINFGEWNPATDVSAGSTPLVEAQSDYQEAITGIFGFAQVMLILRERSLWTATKRPVASNPFAFQAAFPYVGCDSPNSAAQTRNGLCWYDLRTNQVYVYTVGDRPREIGDPIKNDLRRLIADPELIQGDYDPIRDRYSLTIPSPTSSTTHIFVFDFSSASWVYDTRENVFGSYALDNVDQQLAIEQLSGAIADLTGNIEDLEGDSTPPQMYYALNNGDILVGDSNIDAEESILQSKLYAQPDAQVVVQKLALKYVPRRIGSFTLEYSTNAGQSWRTYKTVTMDANDVGKRREVVCVKAVRAPEYQWRFRCAEGDLELLEYRINSIPSPFARQRV